MLLSRQNKRGWVVRSGYSAQSAAELLGCGSVHPDPCCQGSTGAGSRSAVRRLSCSFRGNVAAGDDVVTGGAITAVDPRPDGTTIVTCDVWADVVGGRRAIAGSAEVLLAAAGA